MLNNKQLTKLLTEDGSISKKDLRIAIERQKNVENESLEESLIFLGLTDYAKLGQAYANHYN